MEINRNNYEAYFIDYLEGNLDVRLVDIFIEFLQQNPDLKEELSIFESVSVEPENILFNKKNILYKEKLDSEKEFDLIAIANLDGDISVSEKLEFEKYLAEHPEKKRDVALIGSTKLQPDKTILFNNNKKLYHRSKLKIVLLWTGRVAAILILAFAFFTLLDNPKPEIITENNVTKIEKNNGEKITSPVIKQKLVETKSEAPVNLTKKKSTPVVNKVVPKQKSYNNLQEIRKEKLEQKNITIKRIPIEIPEKLNSIFASIEFQNPTTRMATMYYTIPEKPTDYYEERLLVDIIKEKTGYRRIDFNKIAKVGLNLVSAISKDKFDYETNDSGKITEYNYNSRLLAFSIPAKNEIKDK